MRNFITLIALCAAIYMGYRFQQQQEEIRELEQQLANLKQQLAVQKEEKPRMQHDKRDFAFSKNGPQDGYKKQKCVCHYCKGEGVLQISSGNDNRSTSCPACSTLKPRGYRDLAVPKGYSICPECKGIGMILNREGMKYRATTCTRCRSWSAKAYVFDSSGKLHRDGRSGIVPDN